MSYDIQPADLCIVGAGFAYPARADELEDLNAGNKQITTDDFIASGIVSAKGGLVKPVASTAEFIDALAPTKARPKIGKIFILTHASGSALGFKGRITPGMPAGKGVEIDVVSALNRRALQANAPALQAMLKDRVDDKSSVIVFACLAGGATVDAELLKMLGESLGIDVYGFDATMACFTHKPWEDKGRIPNSSRGFFEPWYKELAKAPVDPALYGKQTLQLHQPTRVAAGAHPGPSGVEVRQISKESLSDPQLAALANAEVERKRRDEARIRLGAPTTIPPFDNEFWDRDWEKAINAHRGIFYATEKNLHCLVFRCGDTTMDVIQRTNAKEAFATTVEADCNANLSRCFAIQGSFSHSDWKNPGLGPTKPQKLMGDGIKGGKPLAKDDEVHPTRARLLFREAAGDSRYEISLGACAGATAASGLSGFGPVLIRGATNAGDRAFYDAQKARGNNCGKTLVVLSREKLYMMIIIAEDGESPGYNLDALRDGISSTSSPDCLFLDGSDSVMLYLRGQWKIHQGVRKNNVTPTGLKFSLR